MGNEQNTTTTPDVPASAAIERARKMRGPRPAELTTSEWEADIRAEAGRMTQSERAAPDAPAPLSAEELDALAVQQLLKHRLAFDPLTLEQVARNYQHAQKEAAHLRAVMNHSGASLVLNQELTVWEDEIKLLVQLGNALATLDQTRGELAVAKENEAHLLRVGEFIVANARKDRDRAEKAERELTAEKERREKLEAVGYDLWREFVDQRAQFKNDYPGDLWTKYEDVTVVEAARALFDEMQPPAQEAADAPTY